MNWWLENCVVIKFLGSSDGFLSHEYSREGQNALGKAKFTFESAEKVEKLKITSNCAEKGEICIRKALRR